MKSLKIKSKSLQLINNMESIKTIAFSAHSFLLLSASLGSAQPQLYLYLRRGDGDSRKKTQLELCQWALNQIQLDDGFTERIIFCNEALFDDNGYFNRQNCRYWSRENPHQAIQIRYQGGNKLMVWVGIYGDRILGPYFIDSSVTGPSFFYMLEEWVVPELE